MATVREATLDDVPAVAEYLGASLGGNAAAFRPLFEYGWRVDRSNIGLLIEHEGRIRGFVGAIYSHRRIREELQAFCNIHSFAVDRDFRALSLPMLKRLLERPDCVYTCFSASAAVIEILKFFRFQIVDAAKVVFTPLAGLQGLTRRDVRLHRARDVWDALASSQQQIVQEHDGYRCGHFCLRAGDDLCYFVTIRRGRDVRAFADVLYASNPPLLVNCIGHVHAAIALTHHTPLIGLDRRFVQRAPVGSFVYSRVRPLAFRSPVLQTDDIDTLYSELVPLYG